MSDKILLKSNNKIYSLQSEKVLYEPKMTSNTLPSPYVASSSGVFASTYQPFWAFSGKSDLSINNAWYSNITPNLWIQLNLGTLTKINKFTIKGMLNHSTLGMSDINSISLSASNDGANYDSIKTFNKDYWGVWDKNEVKEFLLDDIIEYKIYKISFTSSVNRVVIGDISFKLEYSTFFEIPSDSVSNFINYGSQSINNFEYINRSKNYILQDGVSEDTDDLRIQELNRKPLSIKCDNKFILKNIFTNKYYTSNGLTLVELSDESTINNDGITEITFNTSDYGLLSETPQIIIYSESTDDITVYTTTESYDLYDEFSDELEVLYYTDDETNNEANLILEANWSPVDELEGDFEVVTWNSDSEDIPKVGTTGILSPVIVNTPNLIELVGDFKKLNVYENINSKGAKYLLTDNNVNFYKWDIDDFVQVDINDISTLGMSIDVLNSADYTKWNKDYIGVSILMTEDTLIDGLEYIITTNDSSPTISNLHLYILNTTAKIDLELNGSTLSGQLSDDDLSKVQYRVILNGAYYYPSTGNYTTLSDPPNNIDLTFTSRDLKIDDWNDLTVEFRDSFGSVDYWNAQFIGKYNGLVFRTMDGNYYSSDLGEILNYLDFGTIIAGQVSEEHQVVLKNQYAESIIDANLSVIQNRLPSGVNVQFANNGVENWSNELLVADKLESEEEVIFKVRMNTELTSQPMNNGTFDIFVNALKEN